MKTMMCDVVVSSSSSFLQEEMETYVEFKTLYFYSRLLFLRFAERISSLKSLVCDASSNASAGQSSKKNLAMADTAVSPDVSHDARDVHLLRK